MAEESQDGQEKTEDPSQRKLENQLRMARFYLEGDVCFHLDVCRLSSDVCNAAFCTESSELLVAPLSFYKA